eukprot:1780197-Pyramimonas_sp.AAC.1
MAPHSTTRPTHVRFGSTAQHSMTWHHTVPQGTTTGHHAGLCARAVASTIKWKVRTPAAFTYQDTDASAVGLAKAMTLCSCM